ncbi:hypothetical protein F9288_19280 [Sphingomonas sp. CL5.1]|uniref:hypothetical protein n=1 Tax=Sphingomonas sp. CL5.1 TaxID=2653203 RepID=UPI0015836413|nr:hypothetical protein [Sphingomonas sp. CL5.1]QKS01524.1 hypothetical protein F9288_19280 [Sphingomonas sp. CL5.1]
MAVTLLSLPDGNSSLEFTPDEIEAVRQAISDLFGKVNSEPHATYSQIAFGGEAFIFEQEWDEPCLIALTGAGGRLLAEIERHLSGTTS